MLSLLRLAGVVTGLLAGLGQGAPSFTHSLEPRGATCNTAHNRGCWSAGFNINTDYESSTPLGVTRFVSITPPRTPSIIKSFTSNYAADGRE